MTYGELASMKTSSFNLNHVIDDIVNNARWGFGKAFKYQNIADYDLKSIQEWASREGVPTFGTCSVCREDQSLKYHQHPCE